MMWIQYIGVHLEPIGIVSLEVAVYFLAECYVCMQVVVQYWSKANGVYVKANVTLQTWERYTVHYVGSLFSLTLHF